MPLLQPINPEPFLGDGFILGLVLVALIALIALFIMRSGYRYGTGIGEPISISPRGAVVVVLFTFGFLAFAIFQYISSPGSISRVPPTDPPGGTPSLQPDTNRDSQPNKTKIVWTRYGPLTDIGGEETGYGLYSYALVTNSSDRSTKFLLDVFHAISPHTPVKNENQSIQRSQINILYIPSTIKAEEMTALGSSADFAIKFYDYEMARLLLQNLCDPLTNRLCINNMSNGPYIYAHPRPSSKLAPVPPPLLFVDLTGVHECVFPEIINAFMDYVKRDDISEVANLKTLNGKLSVPSYLCDMAGPLPSMVGAVAASKLFKE